MRYGVLFYEAMGLILLLTFLRFGVFFYEATRTVAVSDFVLSHLVFFSSYGRTFSHPIDHWYYRSSQKYCGMIGFVWKNASLKSRRAVISGWPHYMEPH